MTKHNDGRLAMTNSKSRVILGDAFRIANNAPRESISNLVWARRKIRRSIDILSAGSVARISRASMIESIDFELTARGAR